MKGLPVDEREMILDLISKVETRLLTPERIRELDESEEFPSDILAELLGPEIGLQLLFIPEEYGGLGGGARDIAAVSERLGKICLGISTALLAIHLGADPILVGATPEQKEKWLGKIADEGSIVAYAVTEPDAGSNLASFKTVAEPILEGDRVTGYRINGNKQFISNGKYADFLTVLAQTPEGPSFFIVEKGTPGFTPGAPEIKHGIRSSNTSPLTFENVVVPVENLVGGVPGKGLQQANEVFGYTRLMVAAFGLGAGVAAFEKAFDYACQRVQFGSTLIEKQGYTHKLLLPHYVNLEASRAYIEETALRLDTVADDLQVEGSIAKYFATESGNACADDAIQALGGYGYITEYGVEKIKRDVKITTIYEGTSEIQQMIISTFRWRSTVKSKGRFYGEMADEMASMADAIPDTGADLVSRSARALNTMIMAVHKARMTRRQHVMFLLADAMSRVEIGVALQRKIRSLHEKDAAKAATQKIVGRLFASETAHRIVTAFTQILYGTGGFSPDDAAAIESEISIPADRIHHGVIADYDALLAALRQ